MRGNITKRGKSSWRLKLDVDKAAGSRKTTFKTIRGSRKDAERELAKLISATHDGTFVEASNLTVADHLRAWLSGAHSLAGKTVERYCQLAEQQIYPHIGTIPLQRLKPHHIADWQAMLLQTGGAGGKPLGARTVGHAHRVLHRALARAVEAELIARNVCTIIRAPKAEAVEIESLRSDRIATVLQALQGHPLQAIATLALSSGARRGEILGLAWGHVDLDAATLRIERGLEQTRAGLKFKAPKTKSGKRTISLPPTAVAALRLHRRQQLETRLALGQGKPDNETLVFGTIEDTPLPPNNLSRDWRRFVLARKLPPVSFHGLRHSHVSALINSNVDVVTISKRIGHSNPAQR